MADKKVEQLEQLIQKQAKDIASLRKLVTILERRIQHAEHQIKRAKIGSRRNSGNIALLSSKIK